MAYLLAGGLAVGCYLLVPPLAGNKWLFELVGLSAAVAIAVGVVHHRPRPVLPWLLFIAAQVLFVTGDFFYYTFELSFPSPADGAYLAYYPLQAAGILLLIRCRTPGRDYASLLDALIISVGLGLLSWVYLISPYTHGSDESFWSRVVSMSYPTMDVLLFAVAVRLMIGRGARPLAFYLLGASILCLIVTDVVYGSIELAGSYIGGSWLDAGWMATYLLWGAAALHPSMREMSRRASTSDVSLRVTRLVLLAAATLVAPTTMMIDHWWPTDGFNVFGMAVVSSVLFVLVLLRMWGLVSSLREAVGRHDRAERRETTLRRAATALTAASDRESIRHAAQEGARALLQPLAEAHVAVEILDDQVPPSLVSVSTEHIVTVSLSTQAATFGRLVVRSTEPVPTDVKTGLSTLGAQVAMALESAALTESLSLQRSEARVGALVQNSSDVIMVLDAASVIRYVTPSVVRTLHYDPADLVGRPFSSLLARSEHASAQDLEAWLAPDSAEGARAEWRVRRGDGHFTDVEAVSTDLLENPSVKGVVVTIRDITDRKALEAGLQRHIQELEELDRIRSDFVATVSHELRTPLTSIIGETEMLIDGDYGDLSAGQARGMDVISRNGDRLLTLIQDLLTLGHIETSTLNLRYQPTSVTRLVEEVRSQVGPLAAEKSLGPRAHLLPEHRHRAGGP